ncbi:MAG: site-specific DNA-methyltransferase [Lactococcus sp.]
MEKVIPEMNSKTTDIVAENVNKLKELFPEAFTEGKVDFEALKEVLGEYVDGREERYSFTWHGKSKARLIAQTPSAGTLRPCKDESVNWDTTQNLFIEGDNLEVLKLLQKSYHKKVKMIYIDPPYNTGKDFVYKDDFRDNIKNYKEITGQVDSEGRNLSNNPETSGRYHTDWLNMMYPRLKLARNLLKDDGVIVIHIDENEYPNLEKMLSEIFGEENNLGTIVWDKRNPKGDATGVAQQHELISLYCKNREYFKDNVNFKRPKENAEAMLNKVAQLISANGGVNDFVRTKYKEWLKKQDFSGGDKAYCFIDDEGDIYRPVSMAWPNKKKAPDNYFIPLIHPETMKECPIPERGWRNPPETMKQLQKDGLILFGVDEKTQPNRKYLLKENLYENVSSLIYFGGSDDALLADLGIWFDTPKVVDVSKKLILPICKEDDLLLDFFAGSATSAHALIKLNEQDHGKRKFIMIQLPELCDKKSEVFEMGYKTIAEIGKERIRRAAVRIKQENPDYQGDLGFKVFKLDSTNIKPWDADFDMLDEAFLEKMIGNIKPDRTERDVLYEVLLKYGLDLSLPITEHSIAGHKVFDIGMGALMICLSDDISLEIVEGIATLKEKLNPEIMRVVFKDSGFANDVVKTNAVQILKQVGIEDVRSL